MFHIKGLEILDPDPTLAKIALTAYVRFGLDVITSGYRPRSKGVHGTTPLRGLDLRCRDRFVGERIAAYLNARWIYDPERRKKLCVKWKHKKGKGPHLHLQSHPNTKQVEQAGL